MMFKTIWERHVFLELLRIFFLFLLSFFFLYVLIDYSIHSKAFQEKNVSFFQIVTYYLLSFIKRLEILLPFALMLSTIKVLTSMNLHNELVALFVGGLSAKYLMRPFLTLALCCTAFLYTNFQWISPQALSKLKVYKDRYFSPEDLKTNTRSLFKIALNDNSTLLYQSYRPALQSFFNVYWIRSNNQIYHMKSLSPHILPPKGHFVDHLIRNTSGKFILVDSMKSHLFTEMHFEERILESALTPPETHSLTSLWNQLPSTWENPTDREAQILTMLSYKSFSPLACLLAVIAPTPFCIVFSRSIKIFIIYSISIFSLVTLFTLVDAAVVLGETQTSNPVLIVGGPYILLSIVFGSLFTRIK